MNRILILLPALLLLLVPAACGTTSSGGDTDAGTSMLTATADSGDAGTTAATTGPDDDVEADLPPLRPVRVETLPNGLTVVVEQVPGSVGAALRVYVKTGSLTEGEYMGTGISHYYEHLVAGGTTSNRTEEESSRILQSIGGQSNAYTTKDHTCYHITTAADYWDTGLDLLADWVQNCSLKESEVARELKVINKEMNMGRDDPGRRLYQLYSETMFKEHLVRVPTIGYREVFDELTREDLVGYYENRYAPNNTIVVVTGGVDPDAVIASCEEKFGDWQRTRLAVQAMPEEPVQTGPREALEIMPALRTQGMDLAYMYIGFPTVELTHPDLYDLDLAAFILGTGLSSRLNRVVKDEKQLCFQIQCWSATPNYGAGNFTIQIVTTADRAVAARDAALEEVYRLRDELVGVDEISRAKTQKISEFLFSNQDVESRASTIGRDMVSTNDPHFSERYIRGIQGGTREGIREVARRWFVPDRLNTAVVSSAEIPGIADGGADAGEAGTVETRMITLDNGLRAVLRRMPGTGTGAASVYFNAGLLWETAETNGISAFTAQAMFRGSESRTFEQISAEIDGMGGSLSPQSGNNTIGMSVAARPDDLPRAMELMADVLLNPAFRTNDVELVRGQQVDAIAANQTNWQQRGWQYVREEHFGDHPYAMPRLGTIENVQSFTRQDAVAFHRRFCTPTNGVIAVTGDVNLDRMEQQVRGLFGGWDRGNGEAAPRPVVNPPAEDRNVRDAYDLDQVVLGWGHKGVAFNDPDRPTLDVIDAFTSGVGLPGGWLHTALRGGDESLVYFIHLVPFTGPAGGMNMTLTQCTPENRDKVVRLVEEQFERLRTEGPTDAEIAAAKRICITAHKLGLQTPGDVAQNLVLNELYGVGWDWSDGYADRINAVTREDVMRAADEYYDVRVRTELWPRDAMPEDEDK